MLLLLPVSLPLVKAETSIKIGVIAANTPNVASKQVIAQLAIDDINAYMTANGKPYYFTFELKDALGSAQTHLDEVKAFDLAGVKFINGGQWSSQAEVALTYCNTNHVLLLSATSTYANLAISDNLFRLCPSDDYQGKAIAKMIWKYGYARTIIIWRGDNYGDGLSNSFKSAYSSLGGKVVGDSSTRYDPSTAVFTSILKSAERQMASACWQYRTDKICVLLLSFSEGAQIIAEAKNYPKIYGTRWFGSDGNAQNPDILNGAPEEANHLRLFGTMPTAVHGPNWDSIANEYYGLMNQDLNSVTAFDYDVYWVIALSIVAAGYVPGGDVDAVKAVLPTIAANYNGVSGYINLNSYGDRVSQGYDIWGFGTSGGATKMIQFGTIDAKNNVRWYSTAYRLYGSAQGSVTGYKNAYSAKIVKGSWDLSIDNDAVKFSLTYSEKNLKPTIEQSPVYSIDNFYVSSYGEKIVSQTSSSTLIQCTLHFQKDWAKMGGSRETVYFDYPAKITVSRCGIYIDLPTPIRYQNFDILGTTTTFKID
ncbi:MAG: ABC transporter substrate-binding protein [Candidatus Bathyarchaeota archaeon]|nr:ABC transporter substrate-binding protein [Candidatus Bathyarchaeota archaeon]